MQLRGVKSRRKKTYQRLEAYVQRRAGRLLDDELKVGQTHVRTLCLRHGLIRLCIRGALSSRAVWCAGCKFDRLSKLHRLAYDDVSQIVCAGGYELVTSAADYRRASRVRVRCQNGHVVWKNVNDIRRGRGCRACYGRRGERLTRAVFERIFGHSFPLVRPSWLRTSRGGRLELDGYDTESRVAFEYQGYTHVRAGNRGRTEALDIVLARDREKAEECAKHGVTLVVVDEMTEAVLCDATAVCSHVVMSIERAGLAVDRDRLTSFNPIAAIGGQDSALQQLHELGASLGIELLDAAYHGVDHRYRWHCRFCEGTFEGNAYYRRRGRGCPLCWRARREQERRGRAETTVRRP